MCQYHVELPRAVSLVICLAVFKHKLIAKNNTLFEKLMLYSYFCIVYPICISMNTIFSTELNENMFHQVPDSATQVDAITVIFIV